jgi:putative acetyltransferase
MKAITIRPATLKDASIVSALIQQTVRQSNSPDYEPAVVELICANFKLEKVIEKMAERDVFVAIFEDKIVGTISLGGNKLHSLFVEPQLQKSGIGALLVAHLEIHATCKGIPTLRVSSSITARDFYQRLGYSQLGFENRPNGSTFAMSKELA